VNRSKRFLLFIPITGLLLFFVLTKLYRIPLQWVESLTGEVVYSVQAGTYNLVTGVGGVFTRYFFLVGLHDKNALLTKEIEQLHGKLHHLKEEAARAKRLRRLLRLQEASPVQFIAAEIIGRQGGAWSDTLMVNKGRFDGVRLNRGVVTPRGVVGKVIKTFPHHAHVLLMTDPKNAISAIVQRTREEGMVHGMGRGKAELKYLPPVANVVIGDVLITSGLDGSFAKGLQIGRIQEVHVPPDDFFIRATVQSEISFSKLEEVLILMPSEEEIPPIASSP